MSLEKDILLNAERLIFGDYMEGIEAENRVYAQISDTKILVEKVIEFLDEYNNQTKTPMHLVMFLDACDHVSRITRVIR